MDTIELRRLAVVHRRAIWGCIAGFVGAITNVLVALAVIPVLLYCAWALARAARYSVFQTVLARILMLLPVANVLALLLMSHRVAVVLKNAGLRVGPMGVGEADMPRSVTMPNPSLHPTALRRFGSSGPLPGWFAQ